MKKIFTPLLLLAGMMATNKLAAQCASPANLHGAYSNNISTFTWNAVPGATAYYFDIGWPNTPLGGGEILVTDTFYNFASLMQGGNFLWGVRADCGSSASTYTTAIFSTPCLQPFNLSASNIGTTTAKLNWEQAPGINNNNTGFSVSYRLANTNNAWIQLTNIYNNPTTTFFNITGLQPATAYEWRVRRVCSVINSSYITSQFTTLACIPSAVNTSEWIRQFTLGTINRTSVAEPGAYANVAMSTDLVIGSNNNAGQIGAGFASTVRNEKFQIFIDINRNGIFDDGMFMNNTAAATISGTTLKNFSINIPSTATPGPARMRVMMGRSTILNPCLTGFLGETEDYMVNLVASGNLFANNQNAKTIFNEEETNVISVKASPNPSTGIFSVQIPNGITIAKYEVVNQTGIIVQQSNKLAGVNVLKINLEASAKGLYFLNLYDTDWKKYSSRLVLQ